MTGSVSAAAGPLFFVLLLAGCLGAAEPATPAAATDAAVDEQLFVLVPLYEFDAVVEGVGPSDPQRPHGPLVDELPVAHRETFQVPEGATHLLFEGGPHEGTGMARIDVVAPDGRVVWASKDYTAVGLPGSYAVGLADQYEHHDAAETLLPGEYEVMYRVGGAFRLSLSVEAAMPPGA